CFRNRRKGDWPGMRRAFEIGAMLYRSSHSPLLREFRNIDLHQAEFDPVACTLTLRYTAGDAASLAVESTRPVLWTTDLDREVTPVRRGGLSFLPAAPGNHHIVVQYQK
ncbi:MAG: hypothetical protein PHS41_11490, partial [Victivallaceae bacterium]|nr:hypothetical protein [Victivallaceae bacterium]